MSKHVINSLHLQQLNHKKTKMRRGLWRSFAVSSWTSRDVKLRRCRHHLGFKAKSCPIWTLEVLRGVDTQRASNHSLALVLIRKRRSIAIIQFFSEQPWSYCQHFWRWPFFRRVQLQLHPLREKEVSKNPKILKSPPTDIVGTCPM